MTLGDIGMADERMGRLQGLGLTENQAKAYLGLLELGRATASHLNKLSGVPRNKVYAVMEELNEKGLVDIFLEDPIVFEPRPIRHFLELLSADLEARRREILGNVGELERTFPVLGPTSDDDMQSGTFRIHKGRKAVLQQHERLNREAERSIRVLATLNSPVRAHRGGSLDIDAQHAAVAIEYLAPLTEKNREVLERFHGRLGPALRIVERSDANLTVKIIDDRSVLFAHVIPDSDSTSIGDDVGLWTDNPAFVRLAKAMLSRARARSHAWRDAVDRLTHGKPLPEISILNDAEEMRTALIESLSDTKQIQVMGDVTTYRNLFAPVLNKEMAERLRSKNTQVRLLLDDHEDLGRVLPHDVRAEVRFIPTPPTTTIVTDDAVFRIYPSARAGDEPHPAESRIFFARHAPPVAEARDHLELRWATGTPIERSPPGEQSSELPAQPRPE